MTSWHGCCGRVACTMTSQLSKPMTDTSSGTRLPSACTPLHAGRLVPYGANDAGLLPGGRPATDDEGER